MKELGELLESKIYVGADLSFMVGSFSIYGIYRLYEMIRKSDRLDMLITDENFINNIDLLNARKYEEKYKNNLDQEYIAKRLSTYLAKDARLRVINVEKRFKFNDFIIDGNRGQEVIRSTGNVTLLELGYIAGEGNMTIIVDDDSIKSTVKNEFYSYFDNPSNSIDIKEKILQNLENIYCDKSPRAVYLNILSRIFKNEKKADVDEEAKARTGFYNTVIYKRLYDFQIDGIKTAIDKLEKYNGCIIADSVGLGKTFEALAIIKYYELRNYRVLVLCPKKLRDNWTTYNQNSKSNILEEDKLNYDVLSHTDLNRSNGKSGDIDLGRINWGNYDLVVIDESHNFRNNPTSRKKNKNKISRYEFLHDEVLRSGKKTKLLMLSATPVNNCLDDLKNQLELIEDSNSEDFGPDGMESIRKTLNKAENAFQKWLEKDDKERTKQSLIDSLPAYYFKLLDLFTIARSRQHIERYYNVNDIGHFPKRLAPINIKTKEELSISVDDVVNDLGRLTLAIYKPLFYIINEATKNKYSEKYDQQNLKGGKFRQSDREDSIVALMKVNILKRLESSSRSFLKTLDGIISNCEKYLEKLENTSTTIDTVTALSDENTLSEGEFDDYIGDKVKVEIKDLDIPRYTIDIKEDIFILKTLRNGVNNLRDEKLNKLKEVIDNKLANPINAGNKKVIVFTAFADTAEYIYNGISEYYLGRGLYSACITGSKRQTNYSAKDRDFNSLLMHFSPISKGRNIVDSDASDQIDILIATDCISEGQNLQDCDYLINYDIHWNPVRIIQRFGRIDRIGSKNSAIQIVNFWLDMELNKYINLEKRVKARMSLGDISATGSENLLDNDDIALKYRTKQLEQMQDRVVDLEEIEGAISIMDFSFNDFLIDISKSKMPNIPTASFALTSGTADITKGVIYCLFDNTNSKSSNILGAYYLVYLDSDLNIVHSHKACLDILSTLKLICKSEELDLGSIARFKEATLDLADMSHYQKGLKIAINSIKGQNEKDGTNTIFSLGDCQALLKSNIDASFSLIGYVVIN